jgi:hypothetical protein
VTAAHVTVRSLTRRVEGVGHKLYMDNFFSSPDISYDLNTKGINCYGTGGKNHNEMPRGLNKKTLNLKQDDIHAGVKGNLTAVVLKDK